MKGPQARRYTHKAVHTQGGTHKRRSVATAGVMLFKGGAGSGPRVERSEPSVERSEPKVGGGGRGGVRGGVGGGVGRGGQLRAYYQLGDKGYLTPTIWRAQIWAMAPLPPPSRGSPTLSAGIKMRKGYLTPSDSGGGGGQWQWLHNPCFSGVPNAPRGVKKKSGALTCVYALRWASPFGWEGGVTVQGVKRNCVGAKSLREFCIKLSLHQIRTEYRASGNTYPCDLYPSGLQCTGEGGGGVVR